jgi:hypothetical protein
MARVIRPEAAEAARVAISAAGVKSISLLEIIGEPPFPIAPEMPTFYRRLSGGGNQLWRWSLI